MRLENKVAMITGGASGIGAAIARRFCEEGAQVVITDIQVDMGTALANELGCEFIEQDVTNEEQWQRVIENIQTTYGGIHCLVNNAGILGSLENSDPEHIALSTWQTLQSVNVDSVMLGCRVAIPGIKQSGGGAIINMSSVAALQASRFPAYACSKAAVQHLSTSVALYCKQENNQIRCNSVHPGDSLTPLVQSASMELAKQRGITYEAYLEQRRENGNPYIEPVDVANAVLFLASDEAKNITGIQLVVDAGNRLD